MPDPARRYTQVTKAVYERPWAIQPAMLAVIEEIVRLRASGSPLTDNEIETRVAAASNGPRSGAARAQGVAVIPIYGILSQRMTLMTAMSGGTSIEGLTQAFRAAMADPEIGAIVFDVDSPGGSVEGITELANEIRASRDVKPMVAVANSTAASAAYWLASQADELVATPSAMVGAVGVIGMHLDQSKQDEMLGEKYTIITAGVGKAETNEHEPLSDEGRATLQAMANDYYALFVSDVAKARGVPASVVTGDWKAQVFTAKKAKTAGLVDHVETLDATVRRMMVKANTGTGRMVAGWDMQMPAAEAIPALLATMPIHEQLALLNVEGERVAAHYAKRAELRAKVGREIPESTEEQLAALASLRTIQSDDIDPDLDTDQSEEAPQPKANGNWRGRARLDVLEAAARGGYSLPQQ